MLNLCFGLSIFSPENPFKKHLLFSNFCVYAYYNSFYSFNACVITARIAIFAA
jgi:hypothetical protein